MKNYEDILKDTLLIRSKYNKIAIGYPTNRGHTFKINQDLLNQFSTIYYNSLVSNQEDMPKIEPMVIKILAKHFNINEDDLFGYITAGGTEASFSCIWWHRKYLSYYCKKIPALISSKSSHYSIDRIAEQLAIESIKINPSINDKMDLVELEEVLKKTDSPVIVSASLGCTVKGGIDNILEIYNLLNKYKKNHYKLHVDGAIYGIVAPFLSQIKNLNSIFDIADSLTFSGHKFLGTYNITGVALTKKKYIEDAFYHINSMKDIPYLTDDKFRDLTFSGSRQSQFAVEIFMLLNEALKIEDKITVLEKSWNECLDNSKWIVSEIKNILPKEHQKYLEYVDGQLSVVLPLPLNEESQKYMYTKYELMFISENQCGAYIFPSRTRELLNTFLIDYKKIWMM